MVSCYMFAVSRFQVMEGYNWCHDGYIYIYMCFQVMEGYNWCHDGNVVNWHRVREGIPEGDTGIRE